MRPLLQQLAQLQQEHHGTGRGKIPPHHGDPDGQPVEQLHAQFSPQQAPDPAEQVRDGFPQRIGNPQGRGKEERTHRLKGNAPHQLFLIGAVERPAAVQRGQLRHPFGVVGKAADPLQQLFARALVMDYGTAGPLVDNGLPDPAGLLQVSLEKVGLFQSHPLLRAVDAHAPAALMYNLKFHR